MEDRKGYLIDATARTVEAVTFTDLASIQKLIGGYLEIAHGWGNGDVLFVDEEGLLKRDQSRRFVIAERMDQWLVGNGLLVGREVEGEQYPGGYTNLPPTMTLEQLRARVRFG